MAQKSDTAGDDPVLLDDVKWEQWQKEHNNSFIHQVQRGRLGHNKGLDNGLTSVNNYVYGTHRARYYLIGAESGAGKTTLADFMYVLSAWASAKQRGVNIKIFYCSFEISRLLKEARWCSYYISLRYNVELPSDYILGSINGVYLTDDHMAMVQEAYRMVTEIMKDVIFLEDAVHPTAIFEGIITTHFERNGTLERTPVTAEDRKKGRKGYVKSYTAFNADDVTLLVVDHMALIGSELGLDLKGNMDKLSRYFVILRNMFNCTIIAIQQFSADLLAAKRERSNNSSGNKQASMIAPQRLDFGDSKTTYRDADVVFGMVKPSEFEIAQYQGYDLSAPKDGGLGGYFLILYLMKNRYGPSDKKFALFINYVAGICYDLPQEFDKIQPWYDKALQLDQLCLQYSPKVG